MRPVVLLSALIAIAASSAMAQSDAEMKACIDQSSGVSSEMLKCGKAEIDKYDTRLNAAYRTLIQRKHGAERAKLQHEQQAWLKQHLQETKRLAADPNNGSMAFLESQGFELDDLSSRTLELERRVQQNL